MDLLISLIVILVTLAVIALIFAVAARRRQALRLRIRAYCDARHLEFREEGGRLRAAFVIRGDGWRLETGTETNERSSDSASPDTVAYTQWESEDVTPPIPRVRFGTVPGAKPGSAPALVAAFLPLLSSLAFSEEDAGLFPLALKPPLDGRFCLMAQPGTSEDVLGARVEALLAVWPEAWEIRAVIGPDRIALSVPERRMECAQDLDAVIELGKALLERFTPEAKRP